MTDYVCDGKGALCVSVRAHACVYIAVHCMRWDKGTAGEKRPHLISSPTPPRLTSMPLQIGFYITEAVRYEQLIFLSLFLLFLYFISLSCIPASFLLGFSFCLSFFLPYPARVKVLPFCPSAKDLVEFVHGLVISAVVCLHRFSWGLIRLDVWLHAIKVGTIIPIYNITSIFRRLY